MNGVRMKRMIFAAMVTLVAAHLPVQAQETTVTSAHGTVSYPGYRTFSAAEYPPQLKNLALLGDLKSKLPAINITDFTADDPEMKTLVCRASWPMYAPKQIPYVDYIRGAMHQELLTAGLFDDEHGAPISAHLDYINFESFGTGKWTITVTFSAPGKDPVTIKHVKEFSVSFLATNACATVRFELIPAMQEFLYAVYSDEKFQGLLQKASAVAAPNAELKDAGTVPAN